MSLIFWLFVNNAVKHFFPYDFWEFSKLGLSAYTKTFHNKDQNPDLDEQKHSTIWLLPGSDSRVVFKENVLSFN